MNDYLSKFGQTSGSEMDASDYWNQGATNLLKYTDKPIVNVDSPGATKTAAEATTKGAAEGGLAAGAATANPWVMGGMAAMGALSAGLERKRKEREMEYQSVVDKLRAQSQAVGNAQQFASRISY